MCLGWDVWLFFGFSVYLLLVLWCCVCVLGVLWVLVGLMVVIDGLSVFVFGWGGVWLSFSVCCCGLLMVACG